VKGPQARCQAGLRRNLTQHENSPDCLNSNFKELHKKFVDSNSFFDLKCIYFLAAERRA